MLSEKGTQRQAAIDFLRDFLDQGPIASEALYAAAEALGISERTLQRVRSQAGAASRRAGGVGEAGHWEWGLVGADGSMVERVQSSPPEAPEPEPDTITDLWVAVKNHARLEREADPDITRDAIDLSGTTLPMGWFFDGDNHVGSKWSAYDAMEDTYRYVGAWRQQHPGALLMTHMGDGWDAFIAKNGAASGLYEEVVTRIDRQEELFVHVASMAGSWNYIHYGCHPAWTLTTAGRDPLGPVAGKLGAKNAGFGLEVVLRLGSETYHVASRHKMRRESSLNTENAMRALDDDLGPAHSRADVVALGHMHTPELHIREKAGRMVTYLRSGSYKGGDCFARAGGHTAHKDAHPGPGLVIFRPDAHETIAFDPRAWREGLALLERMRNGK